MSERKSSAYLETLLARYQVRRSRAQTENFLQYAQAVCHSLGYPCRVEESRQRLLTSRNLVAGEPEEARVIFTAHYDTCSEMPIPNLIFPQSKFITYLVQLPLVLVLLLLALGAGYLVFRWTGSRPLMMLTYLIVYVGLFALIFFGPANPHTANDNTSGVAALMEIMAALPPEKRRDAAFIFFDNEEFGKVGSRQYSKAHPGLTEKRLLINLDCVGDGDDFLIIAPKDADAALSSLLQDAFRTTEKKRALHLSARNTLYNSDQKSFDGGVAVAACQKNKILGFYVPRIHTRRDTVCEESNLLYVRDASLQVLEALAARENN